MHGDRLACCRRPTPKQASYRFAWSYRFALLDQEDAKELWFLCWSIWWLVQGFGPERGDCAVETSTQHAE
jgi:hypothetical protein